MPHTSARERNVLGALALALADAELAAVADVLPDARPALPAALLTIENFGEDARLGVLSAALGLTHSGAVRLVDRLVGRGLVRRVADERDGRGVRLEPTTDGRRVAARLRTARQTTLEDWLAPLDASERAALTRLAERMLSSRREGRPRIWAVCRLCDPDVCGHPGRCPVTRSADHAARQEA